MAYKVIRNFTDANEASADEDGKLHLYHAGDEYPYKPYNGAQTKDRLAELMTKDGPNDNFNGPIIMAVDDEEGDA